MSSFGRLFRTTTYGESHGGGVGCIIEGVPACMKLTKEDIQVQLDRRRPGQSSLTTPRNELDQVEILSGIENGITLGTPVSLMVRNKDVRKQDYESLNAVPRPGHADYTYLVKYGNKASSGGGRSSARETIGRVAAGVVAEMLVKGESPSFQLVSFVESIGDVRIPEEVSREFVANPPTRQQVDDNGHAQILKNDADELFYRDSEGKMYDKDGNPIEIDPETLKLEEDLFIRCPHPATSVKMAVLIREVKSCQDSIGGTIRTICTGVPIGIGEPAFDKLEALLAHAMLSIPATKGFEIGSGFEGTKMRGSSHNDAFTNKEEAKFAVEASQASLLPGNAKSLDPLSLKSNNAGGTLGGISSGNPLVFRVAFKPVSTIGLPQETSTYQGKGEILEAKGRHDPCVLPRAPAIVEGMTALAIADCVLLQRINAANPYANDYQYFQ